MEKLNFFFFAHSNRLCGPSGGCVQFCFFFNFTSTLCQHHIIVIMQTNILSSLHIHSLVIHSRRLCIKHISSFRDGWNARMYTHNEYISPMLINFSWLFLSRSLLLVFLVPEECNERKGVCNALSHESHEGKMEMKMCVGSLWFYSFNIQWKFIVQDNPLEILFGWIGLRERRSFLCKQAKMCAFLGCSQAENQNFMPQWTQLLITFRQW